MKTVKNCLLKMADRQDSVKLVCEIAFLARVSHPRHSRIWTYAEWSSDNHNNKAPELIGCRVVPHTWNLPKERTLVFKKKLLWRLQKSYQKIFVAEFILVWCRAFILHVLQKRPSLETFHIVPAKIWFILAFLAWHLQLKPKIKNQEIDRNNHSALAPLWKVGFFFFFFFF